MIDVKNFIQDLQGMPAAVLGLGRSGLSTVKALKAAGAGVMAWDDNEEARAAAKKLGATIKELDSAVVNKCACLILAPGIPYHFPEPHPAVLNAQEAGIEIFGDMELLHRCGHGRRSIGITGTNGKSTTTALLAHILEETGHKPVMGGNIGKPVLDLSLPSKDGVFVFEISSYQLDLCPSYTPDIAVLLNITPDHIDRHGSLENYIASKAKILQGEGIAIIGIDDEHCEKLYEEISEDHKRLIPISSAGPVEGGVYVSDGILYDALDGKPVEIGSLKSLMILHGQHNHQNAAAAYAACRAHGVNDKAAIFEAIKTYPGLPHRQFPVRTINGVSYINDSKATNANAAGKALSSFGNIYWILGGQPKEGGLNGLEPFMSRVKHAFVIGEATEEFSDWLEKNEVPHNQSQTMEIAVTEAHMMAQDRRGEPGGTEVVLLSPACASFDQYKSFEERGDDFTALVMALKEER